METAASAGTENVAKKRRRKSKNKNAAGGLPADVKKYERGQAVRAKSIDDKKLRGNTKRQEIVNEQEARRAAKNEILQPHDAGYLEADGLEQTFKFSQNQLKEHVDRASARKIFDLALDYGPYNMRYSGNGRHLLMAGQKGHVALMEWGSGKVKTELQLRESVRDVSFLHNETLFAVAQKKYTYIYDSKGIEVHCLKNHRDPLRLEFLPYHFLLASIGNAGFLKYQDVSTGELVAELRTGKGRCACMRQNPHNAVLHLGHGNGTVSLWSPNTSKPLVAFLTHTGPVSAIAVDRAGQTMVTAGFDGYVKCWDIRTYKMLHAYTTFRPAEGLDISQLGLLGVGQGPHVQIWRDAVTNKARSPYMSHELPGHQVSDVRFCPYEDVLGVAHSDGFSSCVVPGAGAPNFDTFEENPFQTKKQRGEAEVRSLLEKLPADLISLDPDFVGQVRDHTSKVERNRAVRKPTEVLKDAAVGADGYNADAAAEETSDKAVKPRDRHRKRGRSTASKRFKRKKTNVVDEARVRAAEKTEKAERDKARAEKQAARAASGQDTSVPSALDRFSRH